MAQGGGVLLCLGTEALRQQDEDARGKPSSVTNTKQKDREPLKFEGGCLVTNRRKYCLLRRL